MAVTITERRALVAQCRERARLRLARALTEAAKPVEEELFQRADRARSGDDQQSLFDAMMCVRGQAGALIAAFEREFDVIFDERLAHGAPSARRLELAVADAPGFAGDALTIVDKGTIEEQLAVTTLARVSGYEVDPEQSLALRMRLGELFGEAALPERRNPIAPDAVIDALRQAGATVVADPAVRRALATAFQPHLARVLPAIYVELNEALIARGILPTIKRTVERTPSTGSHRTQPNAVWGSPSQSSFPPAAEPALGAMAVTQAMHAQGWTGAPGGFDPGRPGGTESWNDALARALASPAPVRRAVARMLAEPDRYGFRDALGTPASAALVSSLSHLQAAPIFGRGGLDYLSTIDQSIRRDSHPLDLLTVEFVTIVFDHILEDRTIAETVKAQIARLQIVAVKAAILDRTFFARREHPMRRFLDRIASCASDPEIDASPGAPFVEALRLIVNSVVAGFTNDLAVFSAAGERLATATQALTAVGEDRLARTARSLERNERAEIAHRTAHAEVQRRLAPTTPAFVQRFLEDCWSRALAQSYLDDPDGENSWTQRLGVVDALVWSVGTLGRAEIRQLATMLPTLMRNLVQGMTKIDVPPETRQAFFQELMQHHTATIEGAKSMGQTQPVVTLASIARAPTPRTPPLPEPPTTAPASPDYFEHAVRELARGTVVEFLDADPPVRTKLAWISPKHTVYLFTAGTTEARQFAPNALAEALRRGHARILDASDAMMDRIVRTVVGEAGSR